MDRKTATKISTLLGSFYYFLEARDAARDAGERPKPSHVYSTEALGWAIEELRALYPDECDEAERMVELRRSGRSAR